jgi:iron(III) transport system ATP-binding protein
VRLTFATGYARAVRAATLPDPTAGPTAGGTADGAAVELPHLPLEVAGARVVLGGATVLDRVSLRVAAGRTVALLGPSGCGKTTLLRAVAGLQPLDEGRVVLGGEDVTDVAPERRGVGMVFQDGALFPHLSVTANVGFGLPRRQRRGPAVDAALEMVGLGGFGDRMPATLSGGQQQRVALARALVTRPRVLLLDEPFSSLDATLRTQVRADVATLLRDLAITAVVVTHDQEEAFLLGHEVAVMIDGRIHQQATPAEVYDAPASAAVARFLGDANVVEAVAAGHRADTWFGEVPLRTPATGPVRLLIRPEHLAMGVPAGHRARVTAVEYYGHDAISVLAGPDGVVRVRTMSAPPFAAGAEVGLHYAGPPARTYDG